MKTAALTIFASLAIWPAWAAGTFNMINYNELAGLDAPVFHSDGHTRLDGPRYMAQLLAGPTPDNLQPAGAPAPFWTNTGVGYFVGGVVTVSNVVGGSLAYCEVVAWDTTLAGSTTGATAQQAYSYWREGHPDVWGASFYDYASGLESPFPAVTGNPDGVPPSPPRWLLGLQSFNLAPIPEPNAVTLLLVMASLACWSKRALR